MGRMPGGKSSNDKNEIQYYHHQGLQFAEFEHHHQNQNQSPLGDDGPVPPNNNINIEEEEEEEDDLYAAPPEYQKTTTKPHQPIKPQPQPQAFPPTYSSSADDDEEDDHHVESYPPLEQHDFHSVPQAFPPVPEESIQHFPPPTTAPPHHHNNNLNIPPIGMSPLIPPTIPGPYWKTGLFDCMSNPQNALITLLFPCVTFGEIAEILDNGTTSCATSGMLYVLITCCIAMPCLISCGYRGRLRARFGLMEAPAPDCIVHCFCGYCALCQEYRELQERGIDPSIGYYGNVARQRNLQQQQLLAMGMAPPMHQRMV